ncbi:NADP-dependent malic enzyme [hydrothermal vent metagenome]|uniref:NADP-dependent malic enzyme n=1 Tax=hydrothermal vent metagenome TaxID=652676 RepID=A0A3B1DYK2_9ZZZZ
MKITDEDVLEYHVNGKIGTHIKKECETQKDLSLAYTPGVAIPCKAIEKDPSLAYKYTSKGNTVAVISDGTAVLGLGNIGALASKPVMEGKVVLFKKFAGIDGVDIELDEKDPAKIIDICRALAPSFGGINLEDIKAPKCFEIEKELQKIVDIPIMHDDQHGTAIITTAALINASELVGKKIKDMKIVVSGAGAAAMTCAKMYKKLGATHICMVDSKGVINHKRDDLNEYKKEFILNTNDQTLEDAMKNADMLLGLSIAKIVSKNMISSMAKDPIVLVLSNPTPEISPEEIMEARDDAIIGTGRSDYPNQVNNVLGFPFIFRGALDVHAKKITENMKMSAAVALAKLAKEPIPYYVKAAYDNQDLEYGKHHIIPTPFNKEILIWVSSAVAKSAIDDGVSNMKDFDIKEYRKYLRSQAYLENNSNE